MLDINLTDEKVLPGFLSFRPIQKISYAENSAQVDGVFQMRAGLRGVIEATLDAGDDIETQFFVTGESDAFCEDVEESQLSRVMCGEDAQSYTPWNAPARCGELGVNRKPFFGGEISGQPGREDAQRLPRAILGARDMYIDLVEHERIKFP